MNCRKCGDSLLDKDFTFDGMGNALCKRCFLQGNAELGDDIDEDDDQVCTV